MFRAIVMWFYFQIQCWFSIHFTIALLSHNVDDCLSFSLIFSCNIATYFLQGSVTSLITSCRMTVHVATTLNILNGDYVYRRLTLDYRDLLARYIQLENWLRLPSLFFSSVKSLFSLQKLIYLCIMWFW